MNIHGDGIGLHGKINVGDKVFGPLPRPMTRWEWFLWWAFQIETKRPLVSQTFVIVEQATGTTDNMGTYSTGEGDA